MGISLLKTGTQNYIKNLKFNDLVYGLGTAYNSYLCSNKKNILWQSRNLIQNE